MHWEMKQEMAMGISNPMSVLSITKGTMSQESFEELGRLLIEDYNLLHPDDPCESIIK